MYLFSFYVEDSRSNYFGLLLYSVSMAALAINQEQRTIDYWSKLILHHC